MYTYLYDNEGKFLPNHFHCSTVDPTTIRFGKNFDADADLEFDVHVAQGKLTVGISYDYSPHLNKGIIYGNNFFCSEENDVVLTFSLVDNIKNGYSGLLRRHPLTIDYYGDSSASVTIANECYKILDITLGHAKLDNIDLMRFMKKHNLLRMRTHDS